MDSFFEDKHPFRVVDSATGEVVARFTNLGAAYATAKSEAPAFRDGLDVWTLEQKLAHVANPRPRRFAEETLP